MRTFDLPPATKESKKLARFLRKNMTPAEKILWAHIRKKQLKLRFRRQHPIDKYVVDFIALYVGLVIEVDGGHHYEIEQMKKDNKRTKYLENLGLTVIRYNNHEINTNLQGVIHHLHEVIRNLSLTK